MEKSSVSFRMISEDYYRYNWGPQRREGRKTISRNNRQKLSKFYENYKLTNLRSWMKYNHKKHKKTTPRHSIIKGLKINDKDKILKEDRREKKTC